MRYKNKHRCNIGSITSDFRQAIGSYNFYEKMAHELGFTTCTMYNLVAGKNLPRMGIDRKIADYLTILTNKKIEIKDIWPDFDY